VSGRYWARTSDLRLVEQAFAVASPFAADSGSDKPDQTPRIPAKLLCREGGSAATLAPLARTAVGRREGTAQGKPDTPGTGRALDVIGVNELDALVARPRVVPEPPQAFPVVGAGFAASVSIAVARATDVRATSTGAPELPVLTASRVARFSAEIPVGGGR
jgi:hypothetical protein